MVVISFFERCFAHADVCFFIRVVIFLCDGGCIDDVAAQALTIQWAGLVPRAVACSCRGWLCGCDLGVVGLDYVFHVGHTAVADFHVVAVEEFMKC